MRKTDLIVIALLAFGGVAHAEEPVDSRPAELAKLRREVETLSAEVLARKEEERARLQALEAQSLEVEVQLRREELRLAQLEGEADARRAELAAHTGASDELRPVVASAIASIRKAVSAGLPYHLTERQAELDTLADQLDQGLVSPEQAAARLWAFTEDELRLTRENGLDRQVVPLEQGEVLADVVRLGMVALYFRTDGGLVGTARQDAGGWKWVTFASRDDAMAVEELFQKMQHGVRTGAFTLPNPEI
jgi:hypothetical protein